MTVSSYNQLGNLADPSCYNGPVNVGSIDKNVLSTYLRSMTFIRSCEQAIANLVIEDMVKCPCHLAVGQEAIAVGVSDSLSPNDRIFGNHRSHAHYLASGASVNELFAEIMGKVTGCSKGMGGSMHLISPDHGFMGSVPIVAGTIPIAVGAGLAAKMDGKGNVAVSYFGDGSTEEGGFHESLNLAAIYKLPVIFVCENNLYSSHLDIQLRQPSDSISRFAKMQSIPSIVVDGNDVVAVVNAAKELISLARSGVGPVFLEAVTYRWLGHVGPYENIDVGVRRSQTDIDAWKQRDPIKRLADAMISSGMITKEEIDTMQSEIQLNIEEAIKLAEKAPYPDVDQLIDAVYV